MVLQVEVHGIFVTNSYFYIDDKTNHGFLIDPSAEAEKLLQIIDNKKLTIEKILLTHGHFDHTGAVNELQKQLKIPVCIHKNGRQYVENPVWNLSQAFGFVIKLDNVTYLDDNSVISLSVNPDFNLKLIHTPGHTTDSAIYYSAKDNFAFVGDSIFLGSYGRTDFPGGDEQILFDNIKEKILTLPTDTVLLSGHSDPTTVDIEKNRSWYN